MGAVLSTLRGTAPTSAAAAAAAPRAALSWVARAFLSVVSFVFKSFGMDIPTLLAAPAVWAHAARSKSIGQFIIWALATIANSFLAAITSLVAPRVILRQLVAVIVLQSFVDGVRFVQAVTSKANTSAKSLALRKLNEATTFRDWKGAAAELDALEGNDVWRYDNTSPYYNHKQVELRIQHYKNLEERGDTAALKWHLRAELLRKHFGLGNPALFNVARVGTKVLVDEYMETVASALDFVCDEQIESETQDHILEKLAFFHETRHAFGRSALLLSGGATLGLYHLGVIKVLIEKSLLPRVVSGASAGSILAGMLGVKTDEEMLSILRRGELDWTFFGTVGDVTANSTWNRMLLLVPEPLRVIAVELGRMVPRWFRDRTLLDISVLMECLQQNIGGYTFLEAFERTGRIINIVVASKSSDYPSLLNYLTAPNVLVWSAALASCAIPGVFQPVELFAKDRTGAVRPYLPGGLRWSDGSVECDLPMARLSELFNVNQFIVSQVNPHAHLFASSNVRAGFTGRLITFLKSEIRAYIQHVSSLGHNWLGKTLVPLLTQKYEGDLTIVPPITMDDVVNLLKNPTRDRVRQAMQAGERATWPHISWIRTRCLIEFTLDECVKRLTNRLQELRGMPAPGVTSKVPSFHTSRSLLGISDYVGPIAAPTAPQPPSHAPLPPPLPSPSVPDSPDHILTPPSRSLISSAGSGASAGSGMRKFARVASEARLHILNERAEEEQEEQDVSPIGPGSAGGSSTAGRRRYSINTAPPMADPNWRQKAVGAGADPMWEDSPDTSPIASQAMPRSVSGMRLMARREESAPVMPPTPPKDASFMYYSSLPLPPVNGAPNTNGASRK